MKRMKTVGILLLSAMALLALVGGSTASASKFTAGKVGAALKVTVLETNVLTLTGQQVQCAKPSFIGSTEALESESQKVAPLYEECTAFGFANPTINSSGCIYKFTAGGEVHLESCTNGGFTITVNIPFIAKCKLFVKNQTVPNAATYSNTATDIDMTVKAEGVHAEVTESTGLCPVQKGTHTNLTTFVKVKVQAEGTTIQWDK